MINQLFSIRFTGEGLGVLLWTGINLWGNVTGGEWVGRGRGGGGKWALAKRD